MHSQTNLNKNRNKKPFTFFQNFLMNLVTYQAILLDSVRKNTIKSDFFQSKSKSNSYVSRLYE